MSSTKKRSGRAIKLKGYKTVKYLKFPGSWFDERITWSEHIQKVVDKCQKELKVVSGWKRMGGQTELL